MEYDKNIYVGSEIGALRKVFVHRPGRELKRITINNKDEFLIDEIIWVERAREEHDRFVSLLKDNGAEAFYFQDCLADVLQDKNLRSELVDDALSLETHDSNLNYAIKKILMDMTGERVAETIVTGMTKKELTSIAGSIKSLTYMSSDDNSLLIRPLPNLYFQRDPWFFVRGGVLLSAMRFLARQREPLYAGYILRNHDVFKDVKIMFGNDVRNCHPNAIEGGDFLVLNDDCVVIGMSQRSTAGTVQSVGSSLARGVGLKRILAVDIPKQRAYMHLDTVFTMVDRDAFTIYPGVHKNMKIWELEFDDNGDLLNITESDNVIDSLKRSLNLDSIRCIETGGGDPIEASRDQWNDGTNTFAIAPGVVVTYECNTVSNSVLKDNGITVHALSGAELGKGRGGPRCMTMPFLREKIQ